MVTHNGLMDWLFMFAHFQEPLPHTLIEFKAKLNILFPQIFDTKTLSGYPGLFTDKNINDKKCLGDLFKYLATNTDEIPATKFVEGFTNYCNKEIYHEAAFDALQTGLVFLALKKLATKDIQTIC